MRKYMTALLVAVGIGFAGGLTATMNEIRTVGVSFLLTDLTINIGMCIGGCVLIVAVVGLPFLIVGAIRKRVKEGRVMKNV